MDYNETPRILVVDDTMPNIQMLGTILRQENYQINIALNGLQALKMAEKVQPDLILLDIMMPEMDGFEACARLKQNPITRDIPVIFLTARVETDDMVRGFSIGAADYVTKPINAQILLARVKTHLSLYQKTRELEAMANKDGLTFIANRRRFDEFLALEWRRCVRSQSPLSLLFLDIDYFKLYNDTYGHLKGDDALREVAQVLQNIGRRASDLAARFGGEEFAVILGDTDLETALELAQKVQQNVAVLEIPHQKSAVSKNLSVSIGVVSTVPNQEYDEHDLLQAVDSLLYLAKESGRNQIKAAHLAEQLPRP